jgi:carbonic anhydrase
MACTAPLNIVQNYQTSKTCSLKCAYQFAYTPTALTIANAGLFLYMGVDATTTPPVTFNDKTYSVEGLYLVQPSAHSYNGVKTDAELIINHTTSDGTGKVLYVCIPLKASSSSTSPASNYFDLIMFEVSQTAATRGGNTTFNNSAFTLNPFIPMRPYYSYVGTDVLANRPNQCGDVESDVDYIVYHAENAIAVSTSAMGILKRVIPRNNTIIFGQPLAESANIGGVFFNAKGPGSSSKPEIYIDCQLVGSDGEVLVPIKADAGPNLLDVGILNKIFGSDFLMTSIKIVIGVILMILLWKLMIGVVKAVSSGVVKPKKINVPASAPAAPAASSS